MPVLTILEEVIKKSFKQHMLMVCKLFQGINIGCELIQHSDCYVEIYSDKL